MEWLYGVTFAVALYAVLAYVAISVTKEKLDVSNNMLGTGIATMMWGFFMNNILQLKLARNMVYWEHELIYAVLSVVCLLIGLSGIIMIVAAIHKE